MQIHRREVLSFGSSSYLGLELDSRLKEAAAKAAMQYGTQFSSSRAYLSTSLYSEVESLLGEVFETDVIVTPSTSMGHLSALPVLLEKDDILILDQAVHNSVRMAAMLTSAQQGVSLCNIPHNDMNRLEDLVKDLTKKHRRIWYLADGLYSMHGTWAPTSELSTLLERYPGLHFYLDDAHSMSWCGQNGRGKILETIGLHPRIIVATSLNKAFGCNGGVLIIPDAAFRKRVRFCGGPLTFSGPLGPPILGAIIASARIHLSDEIKVRQAQLRKRIEWCEQARLAANLPSRNRGVPIQFIPVGEEETLSSIFDRLFYEGIYVNLGQFPAVSLGKSGLRISLTINHTKEDIQRLVDAISFHRSNACGEAELTYSVIE